MRNRTAAALLILLPLLFAPPIQSQDLLHETKAQHDARMEWWRDARFGLFIHWGLYAIPAGEWNGKTDYGEWIRNNAEIPLEQYDKFVGQFDPVKFDAAAWVKTAKDAGMKYIVITSKHHDGFCIFDSKETVFDVMSTPFKRDILKELAAACQKEGIKLCFYHSIMDWHHPDYLPRREWENGKRSTEGANYDRYVGYMKRELKELLTNYGPIGVLWFDGEWESTWNEKYGVDLYQYVRNLQPSIIINNRVGAGRSGMAGITKEGQFGGDFGTPEQEIPSTGLPGVDWETCMTMNSHWGYNKNDNNWKSSKSLIQMLADIASKGGNFLLNVGPTSEGLFPQASMDRLGEMGVWMKQNGESIYGTTASPFQSLLWGRCTKKELTDGTRLYLHVFDWPLDGRLEVSGLLNIPVQAYLLSDASKKPLNVSRTDDAVVIRVGIQAPDAVNSVVVLDVKGAAEVADPPSIDAPYSIFIDGLDVTIKTGTTNTEVRYTLDGSMPSIKSSMVTGPIHIIAGGTVSARVFKNGKAVSGVSSRQFQKVIPMAAKTVADPKSGISYSYYEGEWDVVPDFATLKPLKQGTLPNFEFAPRLSSDHFGFDYTGYVKVPATGVYTFYTESDDGSKLYVDGIQAVDNDGKHGMIEKKGVVALAAGYHLIRVTFFEKTGGDGLNVSMEGPGMTKTLLPDSHLFHSQP